MYIYPESHCKINDKIKRKLKKKKQSAGLWEVFPSLGKGKKTSASPQCLPAFPMKFKCWAQKRYAHSSPTSLHRFNLPFLPKRVGKKNNTTETPGLLDTGCRSHGKPYQPCKQNTWKKCPGTGDPEDWGPKSQMVCFCWKLLQPMIDWLVVEKSEMA